MKVLKIILLSVLGLIGLLLIAAGILPKTFYIEQEIVIRQPRGDVFEFVRHLKNQPRFSKWFQIDPNTKFEYKGTDGEVGFIHSWKSENENVGVGEQEIKKIIEGERIDVEIRFEKPFQSTDPAFTRVESISDTESKVINGYYGKMMYPTNLLTPIIRNKISGDMKGNLIQLKGILENQR